MRPLTFDDLLGNMIELEGSIKQIALARNWDPDWNIKIDISDVPEELAIIKIYVKINTRIFKRELVIFKKQPLHENNNGFTIQWGFVPHPIIPIIHDWLHNVDTSIERAEMRTRKIKLELIQSTQDPTKSKNYIEGI